MATSKRKTRDDFLKKTKEALAKRVGHVCSNPECDVSTVGASNADDESFEDVGVAAHIHSASKDKGPRANPSLTREQRRSIHNGIHLCAKCARKIDTNNGKDYPAELLRKWKREAEDAGRKRIFRYVPKSVWKPVTFDNLETEYSAALTFTGLSEKNVLSCPRNEVVIKMATEKLEFASQSVLAGDSGCGKSLLASQLAYDYYQNGWEIFTLVNPTPEKLLSKPIPHKDNVLLIVDDAQFIDDDVLVSLSDLSSSNVNIIFTWNKSSTKDPSFLKKRATIEIDSKAQVKLLKEFALKNKRAIKDKVKKLDPDVGDNVFETPIERKIEEAARQETPWAFNYALADGWKTAKYDKELLKSNERQDVVLITVALFQIVTLDRGVSKDTVFNTLQDFSVCKDWLAEAKDTLEKYCFVNKKTVRLRHYQYARKILPNFIPEDDDTVVAYVERTAAKLVMSLDYREGRPDLIWLMNFDIRPLSYSLKKKGVFGKVTMQLLKGKTELSPNDASTLDNLLSSDSDIVALLEKHNTTLRAWFENADDKNAYGLSRIVNTLHQKKYKKNYISVKALKNLVLGLSSDDIVKVSMYAYLLERLHLYSHEKRFDKFKQSLRRIDWTNFVDQMSDDMLYHFATVVDALFHGDKEASENLLDAGMTKVIQAINKNPIAAFQQIDKLVEKPFGQVVYILQIKEVTQDRLLVRQAKELINKIDTTQIALAVNSMKLRDVQAVKNMLLFISRYSNSQSKKILEKIDFEHFKKVFKHEKILEFEHGGLLRIFYRADRNNPNLKKYTKYLFEKYDVYLTFQLVIDVDTCLRYIETKKKTILIERESRDYRILQGVLIHFFKRKKRAVVQRILEQNREKISEGIFTRTLNVDNDKKKTEFYEYLAKFHPNFLESLDWEKSHQNLEQKILRLAKGKTNEKKIAKLYCQFLDKYSPSSKELVTKLRKQFPATLKEK